MPLITVTPPAVEPVTLAEAREWVRLESDDTANTNVLTLLIQAMREYAENLTGRAFVQRTLQLNLDGWPYCGEIELPCPPLVSVTSVKYTDQDEVLQTLDSTLYQVDDVCEPGRIVQAWSAAAWPVAIAIPNSVRVLYVAGYDEYGSPPDYRYNVPAALKIWMGARLATLFENREQLIAQQRVQIPRDFADGLLDALILGGRIV